MYGSSLSIKKNLNYIRSILSFCLILIGIYNYDFLLKNPFESSIYFLGLILSNIILIYLPQHFFKNIKFHYIIFLMDIAFIIIGITIFNQADISFLIAIFLALFMAALSKSSGLSLLIAIIVNIIYIYLKIGSQISFEVLNESFLLNLPFIFIVSLHSTYLAEKVDEEVKEKMQLEKINKFLFNKKKIISDEYFEFSDFISVLLDNINSGIIFLDEKGIIRVFSRKCEEILNIKESQVIDRPLNESKLPEEIVNKILDLKFKKSICKNEKINIKKLNKDIILNLNFITEQEQKDSDIICEIRI